MTVIMPVWVDGSFFGSVYIMSRLDSGDFWVVSGGLRWFHVLSITNHIAFNVNVLKLSSLDKHFLTLHFKLLDSK